MNPTRGDLYSAASPDGLSEPAIVLLVQSDFFNAMPTFVGLTLTTALHEWPLFRVPVAPTRSNGLKDPAQVMIDRPIAFRLSDLVKRTGRLDDKTMHAVDAALALFLGLAQPSRASFVARRLADSKAAQAKGDQVAREPDESGQ